MSIKFKNKEHEKFYEQCLGRTGSLDPYHKAFFYTMGISGETRKHIEDVFNFREDAIRPEGLNKGWQTSGSERIVRLAFNLYTDGTPTTDEYDDTEEQITETRLYSVSDIFCTGDAKYFWEAIKIRYPDYCFYVDWEEMFYAED